MACVWLICDKLSSLPSLVVADRRQHDYTTHVQVSAPRNIYTALKCAVFKYTNGSMQCRTQLKTVAEKVRADAAGAVVLSELDATVSP